MSAHNRRQFLGVTAASFAAASLFPRRVAGRSPADVPALPGRHLVHKGAWPKWPEWRQAWERRSSTSCAAPVVRRLRRPDSRFEAASREAFGAKRCLATASGTTALLVAMHVLDVDAGDEVIVSPFTFIASYNAILMLKALPVLADTDPATLTIDPASIETRITDRTRAIMPVHIYGMPCDMDPIVALAAKHRVRVVEDACQAWLAEYKGRKCGTIGDLGCFSFRTRSTLHRARAGNRRQQRRPARSRQLVHDCGRPRQRLQGAAELHPRRQLPDTALPGGHAAAATRQAGDRHRPAPRAREPPDIRAQDIPGIGPCACPEQHGGLAPHPLRYDAEVRGFTGDLHQGVRAEGIPRPRALR